MCSERLQLEARDTREMSAIVTQERKVVMECRGRNDQVEVRDTLAGLAQTNGLPPERPGHLVREREDFHQTQEITEPLTAYDWIS